MYAMFHNNLYLSPNRKKMRVKFNVKITLWLRITVEFHVITSI